MATDESLEEDSSDFVDLSVGLSGPEMEKLRKFGQVFIQSAMSEMRCELQKLVMDALNVIVTGDNVGDLQEQLEKQEKDLNKLQRELKKLQEDARKQQGGNAQLQKQIKGKEQEIQMKEIQLNHLRKRLQKCQKEHNEEQEKRDKAEAQLRIELEELRRKYNSIRSKLQAKESGENIARKLIPELRERINELERDLAAEKAKKK